MVIAADNGLHEYIHIYLYTSIYMYVHRSRRNIVVRLEDRAISKCSKSIRFDEEMKTTYINVSIVFINRGRFASRFSCDYYSSISPRKSSTPSSWKRITITNPAPERERYKAYCVMCSTGFCKLSAHLVGPVEQVLGEPQLVCQIHTN